MNDVRRVIVISAEHIDNIWVVNLSNSAEIMYERLDQNADYKLVKNDNLPLPNSGICGAIDIEGAIKKISEYLNKVLSAELTVQVQPQRPQRAPQPRQRGNLIYEDRVARRDVGMAQAAVPRADPGIYWQIYRVMYRDNHPGQAVEPGGE